jgi:hypothetical protein
LKREARDSTDAVVPLQIVHDLVEWLDHRLGKHRLKASDLSGAHLVLTLRTDTVPTVRDRVILFDWNCTSEVAPRVGEPRTGDARGRIWYHRDGRVM